MSYAALTVCAAGAWLPGCVSCRYASFCKRFSVSVNHTPAVTLVIMSVVALRHCAGWLCWLPYLLSSSLCFFCVDSEGPPTNNHTSNSITAMPTTPQGLGTSGPPSIHCLSFQPSLHAFGSPFFLSSLPPSFPPSFLPSVLLLFGMFNLLLVINRREINNGINILQPHFLKI